MIYDYSYQNTVRRKRPLRVKKPLLLVILIIIVFVIVNRFLLKSKSSSDLKTPVVVNLNSSSTGSFPSPIITASFTESLQSQIQSILQGKQGNYSVLIVNYSTGERVAVNETSIYTAASVIKIPTLAVLYHTANSDEIDLDKTITIQEKDIQNYGTGIIQYEDPPITYSLKTLARLLMEKSDNTAQSVLAFNVLGSRSIQNQIEDWGLTQTNILDNETSNKDMELLLQLMYNGNIASPSLTEEMIGLMDNSDFEDRIPLLLPQNTKVYHKIGNETRIIHDVGIVESQKAIYYIGILSSDIGSDEEAINTIAQISKLTFDYFNQ